MAELSEQELAAKRQGIQEPLYRQISIKTVGGSTYVAEPVPVDHVSDRDWEEQQEETAKVLDDGTGYLAVENGATTWLVSARHVVAAKFTTTSTPVVVKRP